MAKKKESLSFEERLEKVLVPDWEKPYKVPSNWVWTTMSNLLDVRDGTHDSPIYQNNGFPLITSKNLKDGEVNYENVKYISKTDYEKINQRSKVDIGDILFAMIGTIGNPVVIRDNPDYAIKNVALFKKSNALQPNFLKYYLDSENTIKKMLSEAKGSTQKFVSLGYLRTFPIPLPALAEQQRIVDRIESMFSKLDEAKEKVQTSLDSFEKRKAVILHKAFTGELTQKWREENGVSFDSWAIKEFAEVAEIKSNLVSPSEYMEFPHIAPNNIEKKTGVLLGYKTIEEDGVSSGKHRFYSGQILYSKIRPYLSKVVIVDFDGLCSADMYPIEAKGNVKYLWYFMLSETFLEQASNAGSRSVLPKINQKEMSTIKVSICGFDEQTEIVRILDSIFEKEQKAKEFADIIKKIDLMKKAILARAFRGELGTNDPVEENAMELLKEIISKEEKKEIKPAKKSIVIPNSILKQFKTDLEEQIYRFILENQYTTLNQILQGVPSSKQLDAMKTFAVLREKNLIEEKNDLIFTK